MHVGFYRQFIEEFCKIANPLCKLLEKEVKFVLDDTFLKDFKCLKDRLILAPIIVSSNWTLPFEVIYD